MGLYYDIALIFSFKTIDKIDWKKDFIVEIISVKQEKEKYDNYTIKMLNKNIKLILYVKEQNEFLPGDIIKLNGTFEKPNCSRNYKGFNYNRYLKQSKIYGTIYADKVVFLKHKTDSFSIIGKVKKGILEKIQFLYNDQYCEFLNGVLIGNTEGISEEVKQDFRDSNISHILAISGMHMSYIVFGIKSVLEKTNLHKKIQNTIIIIVLLFFVVLTGGSVSCIRACIMNIIIIIAFNMNRKHNFYASIIFSLIVILILNPFNIFNIGMWLSFMGTIGIVVFSKLIYKVLQIKLLHSKINKNLKSKSDYILQNFSVTLSAQILIFPIMIYVFNTFSCTFFISNILISYLIGPILIIGYISIFISYIFFPLSKLIAYIEVKLIHILLIISKICARLPFSKIYVTTPNLIFIFIYYFVIIISIYLCTKKRITFLKIIINTNKLKNIIKNIVNKIYVVFLIIIFILSVQIIYKYDSNLKIYFVDVSQGDCTYIKTPLGKNILIDGGEGGNEKYDYGKNVLFPYLLDRKVKKIDYIIVSHMDSDHVRWFIIYNAKYES